MSKSYKLALNLPQSVKNAAQRVLEGHSNIVVTRSDGYTGPLTDEQLEIAKADPYIKVEEIGKNENPGGGSGSSTNPKPPTKKEMLAQAKADGLKIEVTDKNSVAEITAAIEAARAAAKPDAGSEPK